MRPPTSDKAESQRETSADSFARAASGRQSVASELWYLLRTHKKWWLAPLLILLGLFALLIVLAGTGAAPFIYTLF
jgi:hypothetical protein